MSYYSEARKYHERAQYKEAYILYTQGVEVGDEKCYYGVALFMFDGYYVKENKIEAKKIFAEHYDGILSLANSGDAEAMYIIACYYANGFYVEKDNNKQIYWLLKSAEVGYTGAQWRLGDMYEDGKGVEKDLAKAFELYQASADQGDSNGQWFLGYMYEFGKGVEKDLTKAVELYQASAEQDNSYAIGRIGYIYENEFKDYTQAKYWYEKGETLGDVDSMFNLGQLHEKGLIVEGSFDCAIELYKRACESKEHVCGDAAYRLGYIYYDGEGVARDIKKALEYFKLACENNCNCSYAIDMVENELYKNTKTFSNPMRDYANEILSKELSIKKMYPKVLKDLMKDFGGTWNKLQPNSQKFLTTSMVCYIALYSMGGHIYGNMDFTSSITPMFKALETELAKYLYTGYINYLNENEIPITVFKSRRSFIVDEEGPYNFKYRDPNDLEYFTLGSLHLVLGVDKRTQIQNNFVERKDSKIYRQESSRSCEGGVFVHSTIDKSMLDYAKSIFDTNAFGSIDTDRAITDYLVCLATEIKTLTDSFRNPAAHSNVMSYHKAEACANYLIKAKKLICKFLEKLKEPQGV